MTRSSAMLITRFYVVIASSTLYVLNFLALRAAVRSLPALKKCYGSKEFRPTFPRGVFGKTERLRHFLMPRLAYINRCLARETSFILK